MTFRGIFAAMTSAALLAAMGAAPAIADDRAALFAPQPVTISEPKCVGGKTVARIRVRADDSAVSAMAYINRRHAHGIHSIFVVPETVERVRVGVRVGRQVSIKVVDPATREVLASRWFAGSDC